MYVNLFNQEEALRDFLRDAVAKGIPRSLNPRDEGGRKGVYGAIWYRLSVYGYRKPIF